MVSKLIAEDLRPIMKATKEIKNYVIRLTIFASKFKKTSDLTDLMFSRGIAERLRPIMKSKKDKTP